jgi:aryl-alcohol dehydrogenase-like predicted oxidoreductase
MFPEVTCVIPGAKTRAQAADNARASALPALTEADMTAVHDVYDRYVRESVHGRW